ncbi:MAG: hypothetical protein PHS15_00565 [Clostridiaceae bacterium]|nr:hypothetical protein [Clostridiaceae bacterium]
MEDKVFELLTEMYSKMAEQFKEINGKFEEVNRKLDEKADKSDIIRLENELNPKVKALFDGYKQHTDMLERIEKEVTKQDEIIMRRVK